MTRGADFDETFWVHHMKVGVWLSVAVIAVGMPYTLFTPGGANRPVIRLSLAVILLVTLTLLRLPWPRILTGRRGPVLFYSWSGVIIAAIVGLAVADGGLDSPFVYTMVLPLIFATMAYPRRGLIGVTIGCVAGLVAIGSASDAGWAHIGFVAALQLLAGVMCGLIAENHRRSHARQFALQAQLERLASVDGLTGCLNHRTFHEVLGAEVDRAHASQGRVALAVLDLDEFKSINDTHGHPAGDAVLAVVGEVLRTAVGVDELVGRTGGEEFAVLVPGAGLIEAADVAERIRMAVEAIRSPVSVTISGGVSALPDLAGDAAALMRQADLALYRAKARGRDQVVTFDGTIDVGV